MQIHPFTFLKNYYERDLQRHWNRCTFPVTVVEQIIALIQNRSATVLCHFRGYK